MTHLYESSITKYKKKDKYNLKQHTINKNKVKDYANKICIELKIKNKISTKINKKDINCFKGLIK